MYWAYILQNPEGKFYIGQTDDLALRLHIHYQTYLLQSATNLNGPWAAVSGRAAAEVTGTVRFTDPMPASAAKFYRTQGSAPIY